MKKTMKLVSLILAVMMLVACAAACNNSGDGKDEKKVLNIYMGSDCDTLNAHGTANSEPATPHQYCSSPLYRSYPNAKGEVVGYHYIGDLAKDMPKLVKTETDVEVTWYSYKKDADGNTIPGEFDSKVTTETVETWEIEIREEAVWQNGDKLTAEEIVWSWEQLASPTLVNPMGSFLYYDLDILNAKNYNIGATKDWSQVGVKAEGNKIILTLVGTNDERTICGNFTDRSMYPVKKSIYEQGLSEGKTIWGSSLENWMGCGPYKFAAWEEDNVQTYVKNPDHWLADLFHYDEVKVHIVKDMNSRVQMFESGQLATLSPDANTIDKYLDDPRLVMYGSINVDHIDINCKNENNPLSLIEENYYRKALYHAIDRATLAKDIFGEQQAVGTYVNAQAGLTSASGQLYRESQYGKAVTQMVADWSGAEDSGKVGYNIAKAKDYMKQAWDVAFAGQADKSWDSDYCQEILYVIGGSDDAYEKVYAVLEKAWAEIFVNDAGKQKIKLVFKSQGSLNSTAMKQQFGNNGWDLSPNCWGRGNSRTSVYTCFYYYTDQYSSAPNNYFNEAFNEQYRKCQEVEKNGTYEELLKETQKLEEIYLDCVIHIPMYQNVNYELHAENLVLPTDVYIPSFGWGTIYGDIAE